MKQITKKAIAHIVISQSKLEKEKANDLHKAIDRIEQAERQRDKGLNEFGYYWDF